MFGKARYLPLVAWAALAGSRPAGDHVQSDAAPETDRPGGACRPIAPADPLAARYPEAQLDDKALCERLMARTATDAVFVDPEPRARRKVIVSDLHLGPGSSDPRFAGIEDFYSEAEWASFLARQVAAGPTDLIVNGDFIEFWQIAAALGALPKRTDPRQPTSGSVLASDQRFAVTAIELVLAAHRSVFADMGKLLDRGDNRIIIVAGNHDADLLWPKVQLAIARAIKPRDPSRLFSSPARPTSTPGSTSSMATPSTPRIASRPVTRRSAATATAPAACNRAGARSSSTSSTRTSSARCRSSTTWTRSRPPSSGRCATIPTRSATSAR